MGKLHFCELGCFSAFTAVFKMCSTDQCWLDEWNSSPAWNHVYSHSLICRDEKILFHQVNRQPCSSTSSSYQYSLMQKRKASQAPSGGGLHLAFIPGNITGGKKWNYGEEQKAEYQNISLFLSYDNKVTMDTSVIRGSSIIGCQTGDIVNTLTWHAVLLPGGSDKRWPLWCPESWRKTEELTEERRDEWLSQTYDGKQIKSSHRVVDCDIYSE